MKCDMLEKSKIGLQCIAHISAHSSVYNIPKMLLKILSCNSQYDNKMISSLIQHNEAVYSKVNFDSFCC
jgi:hypothetical protein